MIDRINRSWGQWTRTSLNAHHNPSVCLLPGFGEISYNWGVSIINNILMDIKSVDFLGRLITVDET